MGTRTDFQILSSSHSIFGQPKQSEALNDIEKPYFAVYKNLGDYHYRTAERRLRRHGLLLGAR
jgi:hypothetical protein